MLSANRKPPNKSENSSDTSKATSKKISTQTKTIASGQTLPKFQTPAKPKVNPEKEAISTSKIDKTIKSPKKSFPRSNDLDEETKIDKTAVAVKKIISKPENHEKTKTETVMNEKTVKFIGGISKNSNKKIVDEKTQVMNIFKTPQINSFKIDDESFHTISSPILTKKVSENPNFLVKLSLETNKLLENSLNLGESKLFSISEIKDYSENNEWEIEDVLLGKGSFGNVYRVLDKKSKQNYALKIIELDPSADDFEFVYEKTLYEVFLMKQVNKLGSPNILKLMDCYRQNKESVFENLQNSCNILILMELCECSLNDLIEFRKENELNWSEDDLLYYFFVLLETVLEISKLRISHRDIKPRNILYNLTSKAIKLADFGEGKFLNSDLNASVGSLNTSMDLLKLSKELSNEEILNTVRGTPVYMSPEIFKSYKSRSYSCAYNPLSSDLFSLGLTFFVMQSMNTEINRVDILEQIKNSKNLNLTTRLIKAMLEEDPMKRLDKTIEIFEKEMKPLKKKMKIPDESHILKLYKLKKEENLSNAESIQKMMLIAHLYRKLGKYSQSKLILVNLLKRIEIESKDQNSLIENLFFKYRNLVSLASIEIDEAVNKEAIILPLKKLDEAHEILLEKAKEMIDSDTFRHEYGSLLNEFARGYRKFKEYNKALEFYTKALKMAKELKSNINVSVITYNLGHLYIQMKKYPEALQYLAQSIKLLEELKKKPNLEEISHQNLSKELAKSQKLLADIFYNQRVFDKAEEFGQKALSLMQENFGMESINLVESHNFLGILYLTIGKNEPALTNFNKALNVSKKFHGEVSPKNVLIMNNLGLLYNLMGKNEEAEKILISSEKISKANNMETELANIYYNLGNLYAKMKEVDKAMVKLQISLEIFEKLKIDLEKQAFIHFNLGGMAVSLKEIPKAKDHFKASIGKYQQLLGNQEYLKNGNVIKMNDFLKNHK